MRRAAVRPVPGDDGRDHPRGRRVPRDGGLTGVDLRRSRLEDLPLELAHLHRRLAVGAVIEVRVSCPADDVAPLFEGAGFEASSRGRTVRAVRLRTLADVVAPGMRMLVCGLNPSLYAADAGVNFARPGNRFWPAALAAGLVSRDRDPWHALSAHGVGFSDLVKRATVGAASVRADEYRAGSARLAWTVRLLRPAVVCFVGLAGYRAAVDRAAIAGPLAGGFAGAAAYLMPNPSGRNAHATPDGLAAHLRTAMDCRG